MFGLKKDSKISTDKEKIRQLLSRGVEDVFVKEDLEKDLLSGKQLRVKLGFDPTGPNIHIGRAIVLRKLREFQDLGHKIIFLVGNFTAKIGDPSDKLDKRPMIDDKKIEENLRDYKKQVGKIIDLNKAEFVYNADWLSKLGFKEIAELAESFSVSQMINRRNFKERLDREDEISLREFLYPLMQGYGSVPLKADVELGGFDQLFNLKAGRVVQKHYKQKPQNVLTTQMLEGTDGRKMSTSWGNVINIVDEPNDMYGKIMSLVDELIPKYFLLCTDVKEGEIKEIEHQLENGINPKDIKMRLAREIVTIYHSEEDAKNAEENFTNTFSKGGVPDDIKEVVVSADKLLSEVMVDNKIVESKGEWKRLVSGNAISYGDGEKITDINAKAKETRVIKVGKRRFIKVKVN
jgi:tyrosyl-tRNA synthetase